MPGFAAGNGFDSNVQWYGALALLTLGVCVAVPWAIRVWKDAKGETGEESDTAEGLLGPLEEAFASGQMSEEEYLRIRSSVTKVAPTRRLSDLHLPTRPRPTPDPGPESTAD